MLSLWRPDLSAFAGLPLRECLGAVAGFHVSAPNGANHLGVLCYSCWYPTGFWKAVETKIAREVVDATMPPLFEEA